jgi:hypothetical protein
VSALTKQARDTIKWWWVGDPPRRTTIAGYIRWNGYSDGKWGGDRCGCPDDRCIGFHHDDENDCGCLEVLLGEYVDAIKHGETLFTQRYTREARSGGAS